MIFQKRYASLGDILKRELFISFHNRMMFRFPVTIFAVIFCLMIVSLDQISLAQGGIEKITTTTGQAIPGVRKETAKSNQSQVVWYEGNWWGVFKKDVSGGPWWVYKYNGANWVETVYTGISGSSEADVYVDEDNQKLYVLISTASRLSRLDFNAGTWTLDGGFPKILTLNASSDDPACITRAADGDLFIFFESSKYIKGLHSTDLGVSWTPSFNIAATNANSALTDAIAFRFEGQNYIGLFVAEGDGDHESSFYRLIDLADPTVSNNWTKETLPAVPRFDSDDHVNIIRDSAQNLYVISKQGSSNQFYLFKRRNNGVWSFFNILPDYGTRPSVVIDESNNSLIIVGTVRNGSETSYTIQYTVLDKDDLHDVDNSVWTPVLENGVDDFNDATISYQILNNTTNLMVCASNDDSIQVWYNLVDVDDIALPVFLASFQANPGVDRINLEWTTHSEVDNWEWIVYRREESEAYFRELARLPGSGTTNTSTHYTYSDINVLPGIVYLYRLANVDFNGQINYYPEIVKTGLTPDSISNMPVSTFKLYPNYPNPFNAETTVSFEVGKRSYIRVYIYDMMGRLVKRLLEGYLSPGSYNYKWNGKNQYNENVASGVYLLNVSAGHFQKSGKMILSR